MKIIKDDNGQPINPENRALIVRFLEYLERVRQNDPKSVDLRRVHLRRLLIWAGEQPLTGAREHRASLPRLPCRLDKRAYRQASYPSVYR